MKESGKEDAMRQDEDVNVLHVTCYCCGKKGHKAADCRHKNDKCHACHKTGHLANVCQSNLHKATVNKLINKVIFKWLVMMTQQNLVKMNSCMVFFKWVTSHLNSWLQLLHVNGVAIDMEIDTGAECSTIPTDLCLIVDVCLVCPQ